MAVQQAGLSVGFLVYHFFSCTYFGFGLFDYHFNNMTYNPGIIDGLFPSGYHPNYLQAKIWRRSFYFSIVTMTTLGFGDMHAKFGSVGGYILLTLQVLFGYVILGALVTRFAILFSGSGPVQPYGERKLEDRNYYAHSD